MSEASAARHPPLPRRERTLALAGILGLAAAAWLYLWLDAAHMHAAQHGMSMEAMLVLDTGAATSPWSTSALLPVFVMWSVMMVAMMLPSALPAILLFGRMTPPKGAARGPLPALWAFTGGYLAVWTLFSVAATLLQAALVSARLLTGMMESASVWLSAGILVVAGVYQWLPAKDACLSRCRNPLQLFLFRWRGGAGGAFRMGAEHGAFCVGCCWALMLVLFAAGVMNLLWVALLAGLVLAEKVVPGGRWLGRAAGAAFIFVAVGAIPGVKAIS